MSGKHRSPDQHRPPGLFTGFAILLIALTGMFIALTVGSVVALAGLAGGIVGFGLVGLFLTCIVVFMVELLPAPSSCKARTAKLRRAQSPHGSAVRCRSLRRSISSSVFGQSCFSRRDNARSDKRRPSVWQGAQ